MPDAMQEGEIIYSPKVSYSMLFSSIVIFFTLPLSVEKNLFSVLFRQLSFFFKGRSRRTNYCKLIIRKSGPKLNESIEIKHLKNKNMFKTQKPHIFILTLV